MFYKSSLVFESLSCMLKPIKRSPTRGGWRPIKIDYRLERVRTSQGCTILTLHEFQIDISSPWRSPVR